VGRRRHPWALALAAAVAVAAGITVVAARALDTDEPPTRDEYLADVQAVCARYGEELDRIPPPGDLSSPGAIVESLEQALPVLRKQERAVRALRAPPALEADLERFFRLTDRSLAELQTALDEALERALYPMATALTRFDEVRNEAKAVAHKIGFAC
jgi:hypothetical protein